jgi:hypothetical protein
MVITCPKCAFKWNRIDTVRPRSTGPGSQSAHLHGHLQTIARHYGTVSMEDVKQLMKWDCIEWPRKMVRVGSASLLEPISESEADTVAESAAIEWCHVKATEEGIMLVEATE